MKKLIYKKYRFLKKYRNKFKNVPQRIFVRKAMLIIILQRKIE